MAKQKSKLMYNGKEGRARSSPGANSGPGNRYRYFSCLKYHTSTVHTKFEGQQGIWSNYVENHLLPRLNGFELLMASYAMAHLATGFIVEPKLALSQQPGPTIEGLP
jgi:hypothetical protein